MFSYELDIDFGDEVGTRMASLIRDGVQSFMGDVVMDEETVEVEVVSSRGIRVRLSTPFDLIENDADTLKEAVLEALCDSLSVMEAASVGRFRMTDCPRPAFLN